MSWRRVSMPEDTTCDGSCKWCGLDRQSECLCPHPEDESVLTVELNGIWFAWVEEAA